jgi:HEAT repeat protein
MHPRRIVVFGLLSVSLMLNRAAVSAGEESTATLLKKLQSTQELTRLEGIDLLALQGAKAAEAVDPLKELLTDSSAAVRAHAASALGDIGEPAKSAAVPLAELVKDRDEHVRREAIEALMKIHADPEVVMPLAVKLLEDPDPTVRIAVLQAIANRGPKPVPGLIRALQYEKAAYWACVALREIGPDAKAAVPALIEKLKDKHPELRREVILALAAMESEAASAVEPIAAALDDESTRVAATYALGRIGRIPKEAEATIRANTKSDDKLLSSTSLWALARVHPNDKEIRIEVTEKLIERLKDEDPLLRQAAAKALAALPPAPEITVPIWKKAFQNADKATLGAALEALATLGPAAVPGLIRALEENCECEKVASILGQMGPAAAPATAALTKRIDDKNRRIARGAVLALANIGPAAKEAVPALTKTLQEGNHPYPRALVYALGRIGPAAAAAEPTLVELLDDSDQGLAVAAAWALAHIAPDSAELADKALPLLTKGLSDSEPLMRQGSAEALGLLGVKAKPATVALEKAAKDEDAGVRAAALESLKMLRGTAATEKPTEKSAK